MTGADGVDPTDARQTDRWIAAYNLRQLGLLEDLERYA